VEPAALAASHAEKWVCCGIHRASDHQLVFPAWQFEGKTRGLRHGIAVGLELLRDADGLDEWLRCAFFLTPFTALGGKAAVELVDDPAAIKRLAPVPFPTPPSRPPDASPRGAPPT